MRSFIALQTFTSEETKSEYTQGLTYTIRPGNRYLNALAEVWYIQGKVKFIHNPSDHIVITGVGTVEDPPPRLTFWDKVKGWYQSLWP